MANAVVGEVLWALNTCHAKNPNAWGVDVGTCRVVLGAKDIQLGAR